MGGALPSLAAGDFASTPGAMASATESAARVKDDAMKINPTMNDTKVRDIYFSFCFNFTSANVISISKLELHAIQRKNF
jgi:hypothetical protein